MFSRRRSSICCLHGRCEMNGSIHRLDNIEQSRWHPRDHASWFSKITFFYTLKPFTQIYKKPLEEYDLYQVPSDLQSQKLVEELEKHIKSDVALNEKLCLYRVLWKWYGWQYFSIGIMQLVARTISIITIPMYIGKLVSFFDPAQHHITKNEAYAYVFIIVGLNILNCLYLHNYLLLVAGLSIKIRAAFCSLIYRKVLKLKPEALIEITPGKITTLIQKDVGILQETVRLFNDLWIGISQAFIVGYCVYGKIGTLSAVAGCGTFIAILPLQVLIGKKASVYRSQIGKSADERFQLTQEALSAIRLIKMYTLEKVFGDKIELCRRKELSAITKLYLVKIILLLFGAFTSKVAFYLLFVTQIWAGNFVAAGDIYFILSAFQKLRQAFTVIIPRGISQMSELRTSLSRITDLLVADETMKTIVSKIENEKPKIHIENVSLNKQTSVKSIEILKPGLTLFCGSNGCGKTTLLNVIMGNRSSQFDKVNKIGTISYASQEPWVFPATIKQNIFFGEPYHFSRYQNVLTACALREDLERLPYHDLTTIEEKGLNLSRGQKARIHLARALYRDADIYLLDDPLSSLDSKVQAQIMQNLRTFLQDKICILATSTTKFQSYTDKVVFIDNVKCLESNQKIKTIENGFDIHKEPKEIPESNVLKSEDNKEESPLIENVQRLKGNLYSEKNNVGHVDIKYYKKYVSYGGNLLFSLMIILFCSGQILKSYTDRMISNWATQEQEHVYQINRNTSDALKPSLLSKDQLSIPIMFSILILLTAVLAVITATGFFNFTRKSSRKIHSKMLRSVLKAKMAFFETTYLGNILNRFSKDLTVVDEEYPLVLYEFIELVLTTTGILSLILTTNWCFVIPEIILLAILCIVRRFYIPTGRNLQRLDSATRSSMIGHLNTSLDGLDVIKASQAQEILSREFDRYQDVNTTASYTAECCVRAFGFILDMICCLFITVVILSFVVYNSDAVIGDVGLAVTQSMMLTGLFQYGVRMWADIENKMTSTERVFEYVNIPDEISTGSLSPNWPSSGKIVYNNVSVLNYRGQEILKNLSFKINPGEKVGIVGRTGAGKTTLVSALYRLHNTKGSILIDDVDISQINLELVRENVAIIPQDSTLFTGTIRSNLDPKSKFTDTELWSALKTFNLSSVVKSLEQQVLPNGTNFSSAEKQLLCLSRALLHKSKILVLDEVTSSNDGNIDEIMRNIIRNNFDDVTILVIAHKLETILYMDKVMVIDRGMLVEYDQPEKLLNNPNSQFYKMVESTGL